MSKPKSIKNVRGKEGIKVKVHNSPPPSIPLNLPTSPDVIPAFAYNDSIVTGDSRMAGRSLKIYRKTAIQTKLPPNKTLLNSRGKFKTDQKEAKRLSANQNLQPSVRNLSIPLTVKQQKNQHSRKSSTLTNLTNELKKPERNAFSSREPGDEKDVDNYFKTFLSSDFPPYNPENFTPKDNEVCQTQEHFSCDDEVLLKNIRQELDEWLTKCPEKKRSCPEQWSSVPSKYRIEETPMEDISKRQNRRDNVPAKENVEIQTTPPLNSNQNLMTLFFLNNPDLMSVKGPKTPSPLPKTKVLEAADQLMCAAERELTSVEAKISSDRLISAKTSSLYTNELPSARRIMTDAPLSPTKGSAFSNSSLKSRSKTSYRVPQNSPSSLKVHGNEDNYKRNNGEKKSLNPKFCPHQRDSKPSGNQSEEDKSRPSTVEQSNLSKTPAITEFSMFYEQQQLVERKTQSFKEKNSATVIFKSDAKVISSTDIVKHDAQTNTSPGFPSGQPSNLRFTPNSSIINMKTSKPEEEDQPLVFSGKVLNVQKMPSVNIRPGFTIQHGPKINIVGSSSTLNKSKRKNTEFFDVVYPPSSPVFSESSFVSEQGRQNRQMNNHVEYICERHTFPSGRLISGTVGENLRQSHLQNSLNLNEKKEMLIDLIKTVTEKIERQSTLRKKSCCRLVCSLPLLASVVRKIQVDCVKCEDLLNSHLDRLVALMKEELRGYKELTDDHCCQLDEAIHYQIVELELMQEENFKRHIPGTVTVVKHKEGETSVKAPKKTVSFESIPDELAQSSSVENKKYARKANSTLISRKKGLPTASGKGAQISFRPQPKSTAYMTKNVVGNIGSKKLSMAEQKKSINNRTNRNKNNVNPILKKATDVSATAKETTVVGQVLQNLVQNKSILKHDTVSTKSKNTNTTRSGANALIEVVDQKDTTGEFDRWIVERSLKIKQIHAELNKMVEGSMEKYLENQSSRIDKEFSTSGLKLLTLSNRHNNDEREEDNHSEATNEKRTEAQQEENKDVHNTIPDSSMQDAVQEYDEDFEEDVEELLDVDSTDSNFQQTVAEAENDSTPTSGDEEVITDEESAKEMPVETEKLSSDISNMTIGGNESSKPPDVDFSREKEIPDIQISSEGKKTNDKEAKPEKVSIATSPINFKISSQSIDVSVNTSISHVETRKVTIATSPVNLTESALSQVKSIMVQTENLDNQDTNNAISNKNNAGQIGLSVPTVRLNPTPIENILKVSLGETKENSLALHADSSNQTFKLIVQLPTLGKTNENNKIIELDHLDQSGRETYARDVKADNNQKSNTNASTNMSNNSIPGGSKFYDSAFKDKLSEQTIRDIIEPTVSEVLKKISKDNDTSAKPVSQHEESDKALINPNTSPGLVKPNIILQTKHGLWNKCDENSTVRIIDLDQPTPKVDSSNQKEAEKQNVCVQVADSLTGSDREKVTSARKCDVLSDRSRSYLEMLLPPPPSAGTVPSSLSYSSTCRSSSRSSSTTSTATSRKYEGTHHMEKLSDGELLPGSCNCQIGEVCEVCIPRLDLSFGELKTKKRGKRVESDSSPDHSKSHHTSVSLFNLPLHLEPRPTSSRIIPSSEPNLTIESRRDSRSGGPAVNTVQCGFARVTENNPGMVVKTERKSNMKQFSEIAKSVLSDLGKELQTFSGTDHSKHAFPKPPLPLPTMNFPLASNQMDTSSSDSLKSYKSQKSLHSKKRSSKHGIKPRESLMIRTPVETPRIDVVIEDPELSTSSYQTSVTSVSVDQLPEDLSSHSSADASS